MIQPVITIKSFHGPMDLLLHLIKAKNLAILDLNLNDITNQYVAFINIQASQNLDIASEYLPLATYLLELQSKQLLPKPPVIIDDIDENEINRQKLIMRLLEYKKFKDISSYLQQQAVQRTQLLTKLPSDLKPYINHNNRPVIIKNNINKLTNAMLNLFKRLQNENKLPVNLTVDLISVEVRTQEIKTLLQNNPQQAFFLEQLFNCHPITLHYFIITFIAILDLANHQFLNLLQTSNFSPITVIYGGKNNE